MNRFLRISILLLALALIPPFLVAQKVETVNGVRVIHNERGGKWGNNLEVKLELIRTIGGIDVEDANLAFRDPRDIVLDSAGNMFILDSGNNRIQMLNPEGIFIKTIGRRGQGPGEFQFPYSVAIDSQDYLYVFDSVNLRIQVFTPEGKQEKTIKFKTYAQNQIRLLKSGLVVMGGMYGFRPFMEKRKLPKLIEVVDKNGKMINTFGEMRDYKNLNVNMNGNWFYLDLDTEENICLSFQFQNRIEKYSSDGKLLWQADRTLNYGTDVIDKGYIRRTERGTTIQGPRMNEVSKGISVDGQGRIWVITLNRQMSLEEMGYEVSASGGGVKRIKEPRIEKMDIYKLEIYSPEGILLGEIPLNQLAYRIRIFGDMLFISDFNNARYCQYKIIEK